MKQWIFVFFLGTLFGQSSYEDYSFWDLHPLHVGGNAIAFGSAVVDPKGSHRDGKVLFNKENVFTYFIVPISEKSFFLPRVEYNTFEMDWNKNPRFQETRFHYMQFALTFLSTALEDWRWIARADYNIDIKHFSHPRSYGLFSALLWGTHSMSPRWKFHIGALGYTGFEGEEVYPVIGLDYSWDKQWLIQAVFPITYSIEYNPTENLRLSVKGRPLKERFRSGREGPYPRSIFSYSNMGIEFNLHYEKFLRFEVELFGGYGFGGSLYFKDRNGQNALYTHTRGSPYGGLSLNWGI